MTSHPGRIVFVQYTNPSCYPPLEHSSRILADLGWQVLFVGTGAYGADNLQFPPHPGIRVLRLRYQRPGLKQKLHYVWFCIWSLAWVIRWRADWIYASDYLACLPAVLAQVLLRRPVIYHEHDSPNRTPHNESGFLRLCFWARSVIASRAAVCVLPNHQRAALFRQEVPAARNVAVVWNCPLRAAASGLSRISSRDVVRVYYHGNISPERVPEELVQALSLLPGRVRLRVVGYETDGNEGHSMRLRQLARRLGVDQRLELNGPLSRSDLLEVCRECDIGLALMPTESTDLNLRAMVGASNKIFDYMSCGLAVVVTELPDWSETFVKTGYALGCDPGNAASIAATLKRLAEDADLRESLAERGRERILTDWNYESQFEPILQVLSGRSQAIE